MYNCKKYLKEAVQSVLNQSYKNTEIILVNDGSTDGSAELCDSLAKMEEKIHVIHQENAGVSAARNKGIDYVLNKYGVEENDRYIAFLDADDAWFPQAVEKQIQEVLNQGYDLIGFQSCNCNENMNLRADAIALEEGTHQGGINSIWKHGTQAFAAMFFKVEFLKRYGLRFKEIRHNEDKIFMMQCMYLANQIYLKNHLLYLYRKNPVSAVHSRVYGIPYFESIIASYVDLDDNMKQWSDEARGELKEGHVLARWYMMDMIDEHYQIWGSKKELETWMKEHKTYVKLLQDTTIGPSYMTERLKKMQTHPIQYRVKNNIKGLAHKGCKILITIPVLRNIVEKKRYPIKV